MSCQKLAAHMWCSAGSQAPGQRSEVGGQAFSTSACMASGSHSQYSASRSAGAEDSVRVALCPAALPTLGCLGRPCPNRSQVLVKGHLPRQTHIWGFSSKQPARRLGSRPSQPQGLSGDSLSWAAACGRGWRALCRPQGSPAVVGEGSLFLHHAGCLGSMEGSRRHHLLTASGPPALAFLTLLEHSPTHAARPI